MNLDSIGRAKDHSTLQIIHPATGRIVNTDDGKPMEITVYGEYSDTYKSAFYESTRKRIEQARETGKTSMSREDMEQETFDIVCQCTKAWNLTDKDGQIEFTADNVTRVYRDYPWVYQQVRAHLENASNFLDQSGET